MFYAWKCSLEDLYLTVKIFSQQQPRGVVYREFFVTRFKIEENDHIPGDYLVTLFSFGRFTRKENLSYWIFENWKQSIAIFTKSTRYCPCVNQFEVIASFLIEMVSKLGYREPKSENWREECPKGQKKLSIFILSCFIAFWKGKDCSNKVFSRYTGWIRTFWRKYLTK